MKVGDTVSARSIGKKANYKYICCKCPVCLQKRWVPAFSTKRPNYTGLCQECFRDNRSGNQSPHWKGGQYINADGYKMILAKNHPLANKMGYIFEHRLVAVEKYGIFAVRDSIIHHIDGNRLNNSPENLELSTRKTHLVHHRKYPNLRRLPGEPNPTLKCKCGCGAEFSKYDEGRPREYVSGHNMRR